MKEQYEIKLSGSENGEGILINTTEEPGTLIHKTLENPQYCDRINLFASSTHNEAVTIKINWGGSTITSVINPGGQMLAMIVPNLLLMGGLVITSYTSVSDVITIFGTVLRIREVI